MKLADLGAAIDILRPYYDDPAGYHVAAEHDVIYLTETDRPLPPEAVLKLVSMDWHQETGANSEDTVDEYDPSESWLHYT